MLIGIMADSHDNLPKIEEAINFFNQQKVELVLHAGDFIAPFAGEKLKNLKAPFIGVFGNNDGEKEGLKAKINTFGGEIHPPPFSFNFKGKNILLLHDPAKLKCTKISDFDLIVYGHTHKEEIRKEKNTLLVNPGECGGWLTGKSSVGLVDLINMQVDIVEIG